MATGYKIKTYQNLSSFTLSSEHFWKRKESLNSLFWEITSRSFEKISGFGLRKCFQEWVTMFQFYQITFQLPDVIHGSQECLGINKFIWQEKRNGF